MAIKARKSGKPEIDAIHADILKADITTANMVLIDLFRKIWNIDVIPKDWSKGFIFQIAKER